MKFGAWLVVVLLLLEDGAGGAGGTQDNGEHVASNLTRIFQQPESFTKTVDIIKFIAYAVVANLVVGVGLVGNLLNLVVLTRPNLKGVMYVYLLGLAVSNLLVLISALPGLYDISSGLKDGSYTTAFYQAHMKLPIINSFMASSVYIIICMTVNRYISIYKPTHFQRIHTHKNARISIIASFVGGTLIHIPLCFFQEVVCQNGGSVEDCDHWVAQETGIEQTWLGKVYLYTSETVLRFGPIVILGILNSMIIYKFQKIAKKRQRLKGYSGNKNSKMCTPSSSPTHSKSISTSHLSRVSISHDVQLVDKISEMKEIKTEVGRTKSSRTSTRRRSLQSPEERMLVIVLISIVVLFVCCTTPAAVLSILYSVKFDQHLGFQVFRAVANNLELLNFALNFYIYCLCSAEIRRAFVSVFKNVLNLLTDKKNLTHDENCPEIKR